MAEFEQPRRKRPGNSPDAGDEVYELADDDSPEPDGESDVASPETPGILDDLEQPPRHSGKGRPTQPDAPVAPLPRIWKVAPDPDSRERPERRPPKPSAQPAPADSKKPAPPAGGRGLSVGGVGHRREGGEIDRTGQVKKPAERTSSSPSRPASRDPKRPAPVEKGRGGSGPEPKALVEATPTLDTYEARQAARVIAGLVLLAICAASGLGVAWYFVGRSSSNVPDPQDTPVVNAPAPTAPAGGEMLEPEARALFERARDAARKKDAKLAIALLERVVSSYPSTPSAREAKEALARPAQNLPLFVDRPVVVASEAAKTSAPPEAAPTVVEATAPAAPKASSAEVALVYPENPAEASRNPAAKVAGPAPTIGRPLPAGFHARPGTQVHSSGWAIEIVGDRDGATMVLVPGGEILMGQDDGDPNEQPAHRVKLSTYYVDQHEVTVRQFDLFQKEIGRRTDRVRALAREKVSFASSDDSPVVMVSAKEAKDFATWAGKRLPTEAQWEMAARGPDGRLYPWGEQPPDWKGKREPRQIDPVMSFAQDVSPYGAYDMAGNAWEWTKDWFDPRYYYYIVKNQIVDDPAGPSTSRTHQLSVRGGSKTWTITRRDALKYDQRLPFLGFRCVLPVEGPDNAFLPKEKPGPAGAAPAAPVGGAAGADAPPF